MDLCFIGAGRHARANIYPAALAAGAGIKAVATRHRESAQAALAQFSCLGTAYADAGAMLQAEACDGVVIVAQPAEQFSLALECARAGRAVFVEKPLGWTAAEAQTLRDAAKAGGGIVMVGFMKRYAPAYRQLQRIIEEGTLGRPCSFELFFGVSTAQFCKTAEDYVKLAAIHMVDLVLALFGPVRESGGYFTERDGAVNLCAPLRFESGVLGSLYCTGLPAWSREQERLTVTFERGFVQVTDLNTVVVHTAGGNQSGPLGERDEVFGLSHAPSSGTMRDLQLRGFVGEMEAFLQAIETGKQPGPNAESNVHTMALCEMILANAKNTDG